MSCPEVTQSPRVAQRQRTAGAAHRAAVLTDVILAHIETLSAQAVRCGGDTSALEDLALLIEVLQGVMTAAVEETWGEDA